MKRTQQLFTLMISLILIDFGYCQYQDKKEIERKLFGSWISNDDSNMEMRFDGSIRKDYYEGAHIDTYQYTVTSDCNSEIISENRFFLKSIDSSDNSVYCLIIEAVDSNGSGILSFTSERGQLLVFSKK